MSEAMMSNSPLNESPDLLSLGYKSITSRVIMSGDLNAAHTLFGGKLIQWADEAASIYVMELLRSRRIVTKKISEVLYNEPANIGDVLEFLFREKKNWNNFCYDRMCCSFQKN